MTARHLSPLRLLKWVALGAHDDALMAVDAQFLDSVQDTIRNIETDIFPDTTSEIGEWERVLDLPSTGSDAERRARILAFFRASGGISKPFFLGLASEMGYGVVITQSPHPFRAGLSRIGDALIDVNPDSLPDPPGWDLAAKGPFCPRLFTWTVTITNLGTNASASALQSAFEALKPYYSSIKWEGA